MVGMKCQKFKKKLYKNVGLLINVLLLNQLTKHSIWVYL